MRSGFGGLRGNGGDDRIEGGTDDDLVQAGAGDDRILGGSGSDILWGEADGDTLFAEDEVEEDQLYAQGETKNATGLRGDWLDGGRNATPWQLKSRRWRDGDSNSGSSNQGTWRAAA